MSARAGAGLVAAGCTGGGRSGADASEEGLSIPAENHRPGDRDWRIATRGAPSAIEGYTDRVSVLPGEEFGLHVSTSEPGFTVRAYRMGWYGGAQARKIWESDRIRGERQRRPRFDRPTRTVHADWERSLTVHTRGWPEGSYLLRLDTDRRSAQRYVPITVRSASASGRTVLLNASATWQAYNEWGRHSLYHGPGGEYGKRSLAVSFDRPYHGDGAGKFLVYEQPLVALAERLGIPLAYTTGVDVATRSDQLRGAKAVVVLGHDEYWTPQQRARVAGARDAGANLAVLGANTCFRRVRLEPTRSGAHRLVVCYKTDYRDDPYYERGEHSLVTTDFREHPAPDPESSLTGVLYEGYPTEAPYVVTRPDHWVFAGTGVKAGDSFKGLVGVEYDRVTPEAPTPRPLEVIAHSPVVCKGESSHSDSAYGTFKNGAGLFATGTMRWVESLAAEGPGRKGVRHGIDGRAGDFTRRVTGNVLRAFAAGPAARTHPAEDNLDKVYRDDA
ncbi:N,N-dimethylformamidase beta subunit family domain-containing protein [Streptomyces sp. TP-A0874]|uniref:N,N-dimethylformamidase beta subunit family domain-containing protein n=1 Tax=Streptomyces sp. TP-A0874 TaxID=549819 RepID=UPI00099F572A|nr:N,N-dimethylformamidase beta subunit family domain-containing protein [Streptomyces sp. TP-A0874]